MARSLRAAGGQRDSLRQRARIWFSAAISASTACHLATIAAAEMDFAASPNGSLSADNAVFVEAGKLSTAARSGVESGGCDCAAFGCAVAFGSAVSVFRMKSVAGDRGSPAAAAAANRNGPSSAE
jgi:hypothetical protein